MIDDYSFNIWYILYSKMPNMKLVCAPCFEGWVVGRGQTSRWWGHPSARERNDRGESQDLRVAPIHASRIEGYSDPPEKKFEEYMTNNT